MKPIGNLESLVGRLEQLGFYKYASPGNVRRIKTTTLKTEELFPDSFTYTPGGQDRVSYRIVDLDAPDATMRAYYVDTEELFEAGMADFLSEIATLLESYGLAHGQLRQGVIGATTMAEINGDVLPIPTELESSSNRWEAAAKRALSLVNLILERSGSNERAFYRGAGNDMQMIFLTEAMFELIIGSNALADARLPRAVRSD